MEKSKKVLLSFERDENLIGKTYAYEAEFPVKIGDTLVVPLGFHGKLQVGRVEKILSAEETAHFSRLKGAICPFGYRKVALEGGFRSRDLGGVFYDEKHLTAYGNFYRTSLPKSGAYFSQAVCFGVDGNGLKIPTVNFPALFSDNPMEGIEAGEPLRAALSYLSGTKGGVLLCDENGSLSVSLLSYFLYAIAGVKAADIALEDSLSQKEKPSSLSEKQETRWNRRAFESAKELFSLEKHLKKNFGGVENYLLEIGVTKEELFSLSRLMTTMQE